MQLEGGRPGDERISLPDPVAVAVRWWEAGFAELHVVDLDAALGDGENGDLVRELIGATGATVQVGGGARDEAAVHRLLDAGADRVIVGTRAATDPAWLETLARDRPGRVMVAADVRDGEVLVRGWTEEGGLELGELLDRLDALPLAGVLCTDVGREGRVRGIDREGAVRALRGTRHPVWISGGIRHLDELEFLAEEGAAGAVLGMALYTDVLDAATVAERYGGR